MGNACFETDIIVIYVYVFSFCCKFAVLLVNALIMLCMIIIIKQQTNLMFQMLCMRKTAGIIMRNFNIKCKFLYKLRILS